MHQIGINRQQHSEKRKEKRNKLGRQSARAESGEKRGLRVVNLILIA